MAYLDLHNVGGHIDFLRMVKMSILRKANDVASEAIGTTPEDVAYKRRGLAAQIFGSTNHQAKQFSFHVASQGGDSITVVDGVLTHNIPDIDVAIDNLIDGIYDIRAGVTPEDLV